MLEVTRVCIDPDLRPELVSNACSMAYSWSAKQIKKRYKGQYDRVITYTMITESGTSLMSLGDWEIEYTQPYASSWNRKNRPRSEKKTDGVRKHRWIKHLYGKAEKIFNSATEQRAYITSYL